MGLIDKLFPARAQKMQADDFFQLLNGYTPKFSNWKGELYESELVRAAIDARSRHISKLEVRIDGSAKPSLQTRLKYQPNEFMTWSQFLYRLNTILDMCNTAFIVPVYDSYFNITGVSTIYPTKYELVEASSNIWIRFYFGNGGKAAIPLNECGILTKFQYQNDFFGEDNNALNSTMALLDLQRQGINEAIKSSASYRFMATTRALVKDEDVANERKRFVANNMGEGSGGVLLFPASWGSIQQIDSKPYTVDSGQIEMIQRNVFNYFGVNEDVLQNKAIGDSMDAFFEGGIEPFAIQCSDVMTRMLFTERERANGSRVYITANRLQYMSVNAKISLIKELGDRGMIYIDEGRAMINLPPLPNGEGQQAPIRGEYYNVDEMKNDKDKKEDEGDV